MTAEKTIAYDAKTRERFWSNVDKDGPIVRPDLGPCWIWTMGKNNRGYGTIGAAGKSVGAHVFSFEIHKEPAGGRYVLHKCDVRNCVNPDHLFLGTHLDNMADMRAKGRGAIGDKNGSRSRPESLPRGETHRAAKLSNAQVEEIRTRYAAGGVRQVDLAREFGVSPTAVWKYVSATGVTRFPGGRRRHALASAGRP